MFTFNKKLDPELNNLMNNNLYKSFRVIIKCSSLLDKIEKRIVSMNCTVINKINHINCISAFLTPYSIKRLVEYPNVKYIALDEQVFLCGSHTRGYKPLTIPRNLSYTGKNVGVGIVDTGTYPHADLKHPKNKLVQFIDLINNYSYPYDDNGHGTLVSGLICGNGISSKFKHIGIAPESHIFSIKAFNKLGRGYVSSTLYAIEILINNSEEYNIKIICLPFELMTNNKFILSLYSSLFKLAVEKNIIAVVPSGNMGNDKYSIRGISTLPDCLTIGGIENKNEPYEFSSSGPIGKLSKPDFCAPCVNLTSLATNANFLPERDGVKLYPNALKIKYTTCSGTSCSAAIISGICALLFEKKNDLSFEDIYSLLQYSCSFLKMPKYIQGNGLIDIDILFEQF